MRSANSRSFIARKVDPLPLAGDTRHGGRPSIGATKIWMNSFASGRSIVWRYRGAVSSSRSTVGEFDLFGQPSIFSESCLCETAPSIHRLSELGLDAVATDRAVVFV